MQFSFHQGGGYWFLPFIGGMFFLITGLLIAFFPRFLQYLLAIPFIIAGLGLLGFAFSLPRITRQPSAIFQMFTLWTTDMWIDRTVDTGVIQPGT